MDRIIVLLLLLGALVLWQLVNTLIFGSALIAGELISADKKIVLYLLLVFLATAGVVSWAVVELWPLLGV